LRHTPAREAAILGRINVVKSGSAQDPAAGTERKSRACMGLSEMPVTVPSTFPAPRPSTGTVDDDDEPEDEHAGENEARERETRDDTELPEEFERDDEDRTDSDQ
jgi:hypothetical protein